MARTTKRPRVQCPRCNGAGYRLLSQPLFEVLRLLAQGAATASALARTLNASPTAINNRLEDLRALKLIQRQRLDRRSWLYTVKP